MSADVPEPQVVEAISPADWEQRQVYAKFGLAIYFCQCLETQTVNYLALLQRVRSGKAMSDEELEELFDDLFGRTFGRNLAEARRLRGEQWPLADELADALQLRNDLVHHWMRDRALSQGTSKKRQAMIEELDEAIERLRTIDAKLTEQTWRLQTQVGVSPAVIQQEFERLTRISTSDDGDQD